MITRPMKAEAISTQLLDNFPWPGIASPKVDGLRCLLHPTRGTVTSSFKPLPNVYVREKLQEIAGQMHLDGELEFVWADGHPATFNETQSALMSHSGSPLFRLRVFDCFRKSEEFYEHRLADTGTIVNALDHPAIQMLDYDWVNTADGFLEVAARHVTEGYEGTMLRIPDGPYKSGRSTLKQAWLLKFKAWADAEGVVIGFEELMRNENEDVRDELGLAKRSSEKAGMVHGGTLGALILQTAWGVMNVGSGFDSSLRQRIWDSVEIMPLGTMCTSSYLGRTVTFKYLPYGMKDKPRHPIFKGFREAE